MRTTLILDLCLKDHFFWPGYDKYSALNGIGLQC